MCIRDYSAVYVAECGEVFMSYYQGVSHEKGCPFCANRLDPNTDLLESVIYACDNKEEIPSVQLNSGGDLEEWVNWDDWDNKYLLVKSGDDIYEVMLSSDNSVESCNIMANTVPLKFLSYLEI